MKASDLLGRLTSPSRGGGSGLRVVTRLEPFGGPGDKVFPATYEGGKYATEKRRIDGQEVEAVLLDSVQSQANRMEAALLEAFRRGDCELPVLQVTIPRSRGDSVITALDAPHRVFDAIFRDSLLGDTRFRESPLGSRLVGSRLDNATAMFEACPTALIFGAWDSTGGEGGPHSAKFPRALASEIVGLGATYGHKTSSRIDPLGITADAAVIYRSDSDQWTLDEKDAVKEKKASVKYGKGRPSDINHSNIPPSVSKDGEAGGVTISEAVQTTVLSFPQLRRLHFPDPATGHASAERDVAARTVLAALALYAVTLQQAEGYFLRSRCHLVPKQSAVYQLVGVTASEVEEVPVTTDLARDALKLAVGRAREAGLTWQAGVITLTPTKKLIELVRRSDEKATAEGGDADAGT
jgi:CRISPR-associated protein Csb1